jgi:hypothetical protein
MVGNEYKPNIKAIIILKVVEKDIYLKRTASKRQHITVISSVISGRLNAIE